MLHLHVENVDEWYQHIQNLHLDEVFAINVTPSEDRQWNMRDFVLLDPSGVLWRIGHNI